MLIVTTYHNRADVREAQAVNKWLSKLSRQLIRTLIYLVLLPLQT